MYTHTHIHTHTTHTHTPATKEHTYACMYVCTVGTYLRMYIRTYVLTHKYVRMYIRTHTHMLTNTFHIHTYIQYEHTYLTILANPATQMKKNKKLRHMFTYSFGTNLKNKYSPKRVALA